MLDFNKTKNLFSLTIHQQGIILNDRHHKLVLLPYGHIHIHDLSGTGMTWPNEINQPDETVLIHSMSFLQSSQTEKMHSLAVLQYSMGTW